MLMNCLTHPEFSANLVHPSVHAKIESDLEWAGLSRNFNFSCCCHVALSYYFQREEMIKKRLLRLILTKKLSQSENCWKFCADFWTSRTREHPTQADPNQLPFFILSSLANPDDQTRANSNQFSIKSTTSKLILSSLFQCWSSGPQHKKKHLQNPYPKLFPRNSKIYFLCWWKKK
jgi:hypothetical protein